MKGTFGKKKEKKNVLAEMTCLCFTGFTRRLRRVKYRNLGWTMLFLQSHRNIVKHIWICVAYMITWHSIEEHMALFPIEGEWSIKKEQHVWSSCGERQVQMSWPCGSSSHWQVFVRLLSVRLMRHFHSFSGARWKLKTLQINSWINSQADVGESKCFLLSGAVWWWF